MSTKAIFVFLIVLSVTVLAGGILGFGYATLEIKGWFVNWEELKGVPGVPSKILMVSGEQVWIQTTDGDIFWNSASGTCKTNCWSQVVDLPLQPIEASQYPNISPEPCFPPPPMFGIVDQRGECENTGLYERSTVYAIRSNGQIMKWDGYTGTEWDFFRHILGIGAGMILSLFIGVPLAISKSRRY